MGIIRTPMPPSTLQAGPTRRLWKNAVNAVHQYYSFMTLSRTVDIPTLYSGNEAPSIDLKKSLPAMMEATYLG